MFGTLRIRELTATSIGAINSIGEGINIQLSGTLTDPIVNACTEDVRFTGILTPPTITSNQNDYNPTGFATISTLRLSSDAARDITGIAGGSQGRLLIIHNVGSFNITLKHQNAGSVAGNRFAFINANDVVMLPNQMVILNYDSVDTRWRSEQQAAGSQEIVSDTYANIDTLRVNSLLIPGQFYLITDRANLGIVIQADTVNQFTTYATGGYYNADYQVGGDYSGVVGLASPVGMWIASNEFSYGNGDVVIWNNRHYIVSNDGAFDGSAPNINTFAYSILSYALDQGYIEEWDALEYDFVNDWVDVRKDRRGNEIGGSFSYENNFAANGYNVIDRFQWGSDRCIGNKCRESLFLNWNQYGSMHHNTVTNNSALRAETCQSNTFVNNTIINNSNVVATNFAGFMTTNTIDASSVSAAGGLAQFGQNIIKASSVDISNATNRQVNQNYIQASTVTLTNFAGSVSEFNNNKITNGSSFDGTNATCLVQYNDFNITTISASSCSGTVASNLVHNSTVDLTTCTNWFIACIVKDSTIDLSASTNRFFSNIVDNVPSMSLTNNSGFISYNTFERTASISGLNNSGLIAYNKVMGNAFLDITAFSGSLTDSIIDRNSSLDISGSAGLIGSLIMNYAVLNAANFAGQINGMNMLGSSGDIASALGTFNNCDFKNGSSLYARNIVATVSNCVADNTSVYELTDADGTISNCIATSGSTIDAAAQISTGILSAISADSGSYCDANVNEDNISNCDFSSTCRITVSRKSGVQMDSCSFSGRLTHTINDSIAYSSKVMRPEYNTFDSTYDITGLGTLDLAAHVFAGIINMTSTNASETVSVIQNSSDEWPITFVPEDGLTVRIVATPVASAVADEIVLENDTTVNLVGRTLVSDKIILKNENAVLRQVAGSII